MPPKSYFQGYADSLIQSDDFISFSRLIYQIVGRNAPAAMILERICYWHGTSAKTGKCRLAVESDGKLWLAKNYTAWEAECCVNDSTARKALDRLEALRIIETKTGKFNGLNSLFIRVIPEQFEYLSNMVGLSVQNGHLPSVQNGHFHKQESTQEQESTIIKDSASPNGNGHNPDILPTSLPTTVKKNSPEYMALDSYVKQAIYGGVSIGQQGGTLIQYLVIQKATPETVATFIKWYTATNENAAIPRQITRQSKTDNFSGKFVTWWETWQNATKSKVYNSHAIPVENTVIETPPPLSQAELDSLAKPRGYKPPVLGGNHE